jgi:hypothetical protein
MVAWATAGEWRLAIENVQNVLEGGGVEDDVMLDKEVFAKWNGMMGRRPHSERLGTPWRMEVDDTIRRFMAVQTADEVSSDRKAGYTGIVWYL